MKEEQIREALRVHWLASANGDVNAEHEIYETDAVCDYPQSGERIVGRSNLQALRSHHPDKPSGFDVRRIVGSRRSVDYRIHDHLSGPTSTYCKHHGVPQR